MSTRHNNAMHIYDYIIIGSGLTGLTIAKKIAQETDNILVLEAQDFVGGSNRVVQVNNQNINNGIRFFPATDAAEKAMNFFETLLDKKIVGEKADNQPEYYESHGFKQFVGFGDKSPEFYDQLGYFLAQKEFPLTVQTNEWIEALQTGLQDAIQLKSIVTKFGFENLETNEPTLTHVMVNGSKQIYARNFIFAGPVKDLGLLLPDDVLSLRAKAKLKKARAWQGVCLDIFHSATLDKTNLFVLNGTTDDDIGPGIGRFLPATEEGQISQWMSFIDSESAEDTEMIAHVLKKMKRQIKRAFPEIGESIKSERIFVTPALSGADIKLTASNTVPKVKNLWIASPEVAPSVNLLGSLQQSQLVLAALGFGSGIEIDSPERAHHQSDEHEADLT